MECFAQRRKASQRRQNEQPHKLSEPTIQIRVRRLFLNVNFITYIIRAPSVAKISAHSNPKRSKCNEELS